MPGTTPPTSQLDGLISTTAMIALSWSRATRDLLRSFGSGIGQLHQLRYSDDGAISSPPAPYHLSAGGRRIRTAGPPLKTGDFSEQASSTPPAGKTSRNRGIRPERDRWFEPVLLHQGI